MKFIREIHLSARRVVDRVPFFQGGHKGPPLQNVNRYDPEKHHRRSIRLKGYDYSRNGSYFVTICVQNRQCLFGEIIDGIMHINDAGRMILKRWLELTHKFPTIDNQPYVIMPNHVHGIITIQYENAKSDVLVGADLGVRPVNSTGGHPSPLPRDVVSLPRIIHWFKTVTTYEYIQKIRTANWQPYDKRLWQRNYYEHIIRNHTEFVEIRDYIANNPARWNFDDENPENMVKEKQKADT